MGIAPPTLVIAHPSPQPSPARGEGTLVAKASMLLLPLRERAGVRGNARRRSSHGLAIARIRRNGLTKSKNLL